MITPSSVFSGADIDYSNPFTEGLEYAVLVSGGRVIDMLAKSEPDLVQATLNSNPFGPVVRLAETFGLTGTSIQPGLNRGFLDAIDNKVFSTYTKFKVGTLGGTIVSTYQTSIPKFRLLVSSTNINFIIDDVTFGLGTFFSSGDTQVGVGHTANDTTVTGYQNGFEKNTQNISGTTPTAGDVDLQIGASFSVPPNLANSLLGSAEINIALGWSRPLTLEEHADIHANPWQIFRGLDRTFLFMARSEGFLVSGPSILSGAGFKTALGTSDLIAGVSVLDADGFRAIPATGSLVSDIALLDGDGFKTLNGTGSLVSDIALLNGDGFKTLNGTGSLVSGTAFLSGLGTTLNTGTGLLVSDIASLSGDGTLVGLLTGSLVSDISELDGVGTKTGRLNGDLISSNASIDSTGFKTAFINGDLQSENAFLSGTGRKVGQGTGNLVSQNAEISGFGFKSFVLTSAQRSQNFVFSQRSQNYILG
jgi:hypothetical protein